MTAAPGMVERVARALCLAQFADEAIHGDARCCQVGGKDGCCLEALMPQARAAIEACFKFPKHAASMHLMHNDHKSCYQTVEQSIRDEDHGYHPADWVSDEQREKAIATNECWSLQWYPDTPIGFCNLSAADLPALLDAALKGEG